METHGILKKAADKCSAVRTRYQDRNVPTSIENIVVLPFFGDKRSSFILSSLLLRRIREELKGSKYFILLSWPGQEGLYPYVDEYWQMEDEIHLSKLRAGVAGFQNTSAAFSIIQKSLNQYFYDVMSEDDFSTYYSNGLTKAFFERFKHIKVSLPTVPSVSSVGTDMARSLSQRPSKVFVYPSKEIFSLRNGKVSGSPAPIEFWKDVVSKLSGSRFFPVVFSDPFSYDLSEGTGNGALYLSGLNTLEMMAVMRSCGCVLDFFSDISRIALAARTPFVCFEERAKFNFLKEYEINDLCGKKVPKDYIFGFSAIIEKGDKASWNSNILDHMLVKLEKVYDSVDRDKWPSAAESNEIVAYDSVRKIKNKKFGSRFIKIER